MPKLELASDQDFWSGTYAGRRIAIFNEHGRWHAYLDHALQPNLVFVSAEHAVKWLTRRVVEASVARAGQLHLAIRQSFDGAFAGFGCWPAL